MARKTKIESAQTRCAILDAAEIEMQARGVASASFERIARRANVTRGAIYWHFDDKTALLGAMIARTHLPMRDLRQCLSAALPDHDPVGLLRSMLLHGLNRLAADAHHRRVCHIILHRCEVTDEGHPAAELMRAAFEDCRDVLVSLCREAEQTDQINPAVGVDNTSDMILSFMSGVYDCSLRHPDLYRADRDWEPIVDALLAGLFRTVPVQQTV